MPDDKNVSQKIQLLAGRIQGRVTTYTEDIRLDRVIKAKRITNRQDVREVLAEALEKNANVVLTTLNSHDDSDRLIDEIVSELKK